MNKRKEIIDKILPTIKYGCYFRLVDVTDAEFILSLRNDENLSRFINETSNKLQNQIHWLEEYKLREAKGTEFYIICMSIDNKIRYGLNRLYDITSDDYEIGSWLFGPDAPKDKAILGDLFVQSIAFEILNLKICRMSVKKKNIRVVKYAKLFDPTLTDEDDLSYYFIYDYVTWLKQRNKLLKILGYD